jgi:hypothetical protein
LVELPSLAPAAFIACRADLVRSDISPVYPRSYDRADIDADASDEIREVKQSLASGTAEIEQIRSVEIAAKRTKVADRGGELEGVDRSRAVLGIPSLGDGVELQSQIR